MKYFLVLFLLSAIQMQSISQLKSYTFYQLYQLDSIGESPSVSRHFGKLYHDFLLLVEEKLQKEDSATIKLVRNFEAVFAQFYIDACVAYSHHNQAPLPAWRAYFMDTTLEFYQYYLLGTNAHLNGGLAEAIANSYTTEQWKIIKTKYYLFNSCLNKTYRFVYKETVNSNKKAKTAHGLTLGLGKMLGYYYLYKWRKRQMRLTEYYFTGSPKYKKLLTKINRKKDRIDKKIVTQL